MFRLWDQGQRHLAAARYIAARRDLEAAEAIAWRNRDARTLARLYLSLLEARRQIRYHAVEGTLLIDPAGVAQRSAPLRQFMHAPPPAGVLLIGTPADPRSIATATHIARDIQYAALRTGACLEALLLIRSGSEIRLAPPPDPRFAAGFPIRWTLSPGEQIANSTEPELVVPLPPAGCYAPPATRLHAPAEVAADPARAKLHALARESLIVAWEALALRWQHRHPPVGARGMTPRESAWREIAWLRRTLLVDPACEPVTMRLIALGEAIERL
jgi:hypothetical protein